MNDTFEKIEYHLCGVVILSLYALVAAGPIFLFCQLAYLGVRTVLEIFSRFL